MSTGFLLILLFVMHRSGSSLTKSITFLFMALSSYGASLVWFLKTNAREIILSYWEFALFYVVAMFLLSLLVISALRSFDNSTHTLRVSVKWMIRLAGVTMLYNSSSSPLLSLLVLFSTFFLYIVYEIVKTATKNTKKGKRY